LKGTDLSWTKGLRIALFVVFIIALILGFFIYARYNSEYAPDDWTFIEVVGFGCICFSAVCLIYYLVDWIIRGFHDEDKKETQEVKEQI
jgi:hypothetical protein